MKGADGVRLSITPDFITIIDADPRQKHVFENHLNATKVKAGWRLPKNVWSMRELAKQFPQLLGDLQFMNEGRRLREEVDKMIDSRRYSANAANLFESKLRPYQLADMFYLKDLPQAGIFNEPRTGKTPTTITLIKELGTKRNLIVAPASLIYNWEKEFKQWYPDSTVFVSSGSKAQRQNLYRSLSNTSGQRAGVTLIVSKDTLKSDIGDDFWKNGFDLMAVDEAHFLRNYQSKQSEAIYKVKAYRRYALTGTPTVKHPADIFGILKFLYPNAYPSYWQFADRYFGSSMAFHGGQEVNRTVKPHRKQELQEMIGLISVQRKRQEVMAWLPDKQRMNIPVEIEGKQLKMYREMEKYFATMNDATGEEIDAQTVLAQLMRMRQLLLDPRLLQSDVRGAKTEAILEWLDDNREPVVIMSMFTSYLKLLKPEIEKLGLKVGMIHGEMSNQEKQESATSFQHGNLDVLLCNIISAGTGFTLDRAETIIFTDKAWNPADQEQSESRILPTTEERNHKVTIITFECRGTVDDRINRILDEKQSLTDVVNVGGMEAVRRLLAGR